jgi:hypothetical protein
MDKSNSINKSIVEQLVNSTVVYLRDWSKAELSALVDNPDKSGKMPVILRFGKHGYIVGNHAVRTIDNKWWLVNYRFNDVEHVFTSKLSAICYAVCHEVNKIKLADRILHDDTAVGRLSIKAEQFQTRLKQAQKKKNSFKIDLFLVRYEETTNQLNESKSQLDKSLKLAKYFKF